MSDGWRSVAHLLEDAPVDNHMRRGQCGARWLRLQHQNAFPCKAAHIALPSEVASHLRVEAGAWPVLGSGRVDKPALTRRAREELGVRED